MSSLVDTQERNSKLKKLLRSNVRRGRWPEVFGMCQRDRQLFTEDISGTGGTVLHMAVSDGKEKVVANMVDYFLVHQELMDILEAKNKIENTPLHLAAVTGNVEICKKISRAKPSLIAKRNIAGETPLFLAALYGRKKAFLWLHYLYRATSQASSGSHVPYKRNNDDTILHCAIEQRHIDLAIEIIHLYRDDLKEMVKRNKEGLSPLHLLAAQRSAFESTGLLERSILIRPIYWLWRVKKKKQATTMEELKRAPCGKALYDVLKEYLARRWLQRMWLPHIISRKASDPENPAQTEAKNENEENIPADFKKFIYSLLLFLLVILLLPCYLFGKAGIWLYQIRKMKEKHTWSVQIMKELLQHASDEDMSQVISRSASQQLSLQTKEKNGSTSMETPVGKITIETPLIIAAKNGVEEMVGEILKLFPSRIEDVNEDGKNIVLLAIECRQTNVYEFLDAQKWPTESLFWRVDKDRNNALHLAARLGVEPDWLNPEEALSMSREINWFEYVKHSVPRGLLERYNREMKTPEDIFKESHKELMKSEGEWVAKTSQACSVVSTLVMSVAFDTRNNVPGGYDTKGYAILRNKPLAFKCFSYASLGALAFSLMSTIYFLSTLVVARSQSVHSWKFLPFTLYLGMSFMFSSIVFLWVSFCGGYFFTLDDRSQEVSNGLRYYVLMSLPTILLVVSQVPTFIGPTLSSIRPIPASRRKATRPIEYRN